MQGNIVNLMCEHYSHILQSYRRNMSEMSTEQLLIMCAAFDSTRATTKGYKKALERALDDHALIMSCNRRQLNGEKRAIGEVIAPDGSKRVAVYGYSLFNKDQLPWMWSLTKVGRSGENGIRFSDFAQARPRSTKFILRILDDEMVQGLARISPRWKDKVLTEYKMVEGCRWTPLPGDAPLLPFQEYSLIVTRK